MYHQWHIHKRAYINNQGNHKKRGAREGVRGEQREMNRKSGGSRFMVYVEQNVWHPRKIDFRWFEIAIYWRRRYGLYGVRRRAAVREGKRREMRMQWTIMWHGIVCNIFHLKHFIRDSWLPIIVVHICVSMYTATTQRLRAWIRLFENRLHFS